MRQKISSESGGDYLQFYIDSTLKDQISGEVGWQQKSYPVDAGTHTLKWRYVKNSSGYSGDDCAWVDFVQWTGPSPAQNPANWQEIAYKHDVTGRRVEKKVDGYSTRYVYDGPHVIAEYDGNNNLLRKYIFGPGIDQPVSMIEVADANATYYYHFDALGSVVALSNAAGDTVQTYEYSVYGEVAVEDANHTNPYMFAGVRYDIEIGLYYNRARYYNPYTGRFLQTDPIGYEAGMNLYLYCHNNPGNYVDPFGLDTSDSNNRADCSAEEQEVEDARRALYDAMIEGEKANKALDEAERLSNERETAEADALSAYKKAKENVQINAIGVVAAAGLMWSACGGFVTTKSFYLGVGCVAAVLNHHVWQLRLARAVKDRNETRDKYESAKAAHDRAQALQEDARLRVAKALSAFDAAQVRLHDAKLALNACRQRNNQP